jgi:hypothetical protein
MLRLHCNTTGGELTSVRGQHFVVWDGEPRERVYWHFGQTCARGALVHRIWDHLEGLREA